MTKAAAPAPSTDLVVELLASEYGLGGDVSRLTGENSNYRIDVPDGRRFVLKVAASGVTSEMIDLEHRAVERAHAAGIGLSLPRLVATGAGRIEACHRAADGTELRARLLEFVPGTAWCEAGAGAGGEAGEGAGAGVGAEAASLRPGS